MTRPRRRTVGHRLLPFRMIDHDEMTGTSAWDDWERLRITLRIAAGILDDLYRVDVGLPARPDAYSGHDTPAQPQLLHELLPMIRCTCCDARGIPTQSNHCPRCGRGGTGWALQEQVPVATVGQLRRLW